jgi:uncharacterized membrane protein
MGTLDLPLTVSYRTHTIHTKEAMYVIYLALKLVHIAAVVWFLGNIITGLFWKAYADRTKDLRVIAHTMEGIVQSDHWFTIPGVIVILIGGLGAAIAGGIPILRTGWIFWSIVLFTISGAAFMLRVVPLQAQLAALARAGSEEGPFNWDRYRAWSWQWKFWGLVALLTPALAAVLMVFKPNLPGL